MNRKFSVWAIIVLFIGLAYFAISPLFNNIEVQDELPENVIVESENTEIVSSGFEDLSRGDKEEMLKQIEEVNEVPALPMDEEVPEVVVSEEIMEDEEVEKPTTSPVIGTTGHSASGQVRVLQTTTGTVIRYEDFSTINGPRLHVYLAKDLKAKDFIDLGAIKGTSGNINYEVPEGIDISEYKYIMYWCVPFKVLFNYAEIS